MLRGRRFECSSTRRKTCLRKKFHQFLREQEMLPAKEGSAGSSAGSAEDIVLPLEPTEEPPEPSSAGSSGRTFGTFFRWNARKNLLPFLPRVPVEELLLPLQYPTAPPTCAEEGSSRGRTFVFNLSHHTSLVSSILRPLTLPNEDTRLEH